MASLPLWADEPEFEDDFNRIQSLETTNGRVFSSVEILKVDANGLIFRHSRGLAKVVFADLSPAIRERFGYDPAAAEDFVESRKPEPKPAAEPKKPRRILIIFRPRPQIVPCSPIPVPLLSCQQLPYPHSLAQYPNRRLAELDFLYTTGILPRPPGVTVRRIWSSF